MPTNQTPQREMPSKIRDELLDKTRGTDMTNKHKVMAVETQTGVGQTKGYSGAGIKHENRSFRAKIKYLAGSLDGDDVLKLSEDLFKQLFDSNANHRYVAIHSIQNSLPHLGWLLFSAELDRTLPPHTCAVAVTIRFSLPSNVMIRACSPCNLESAILSLPPNAYREMEHETAAEVLAKFETNGRFPLLRQGEFRPEVPCRVRLCEPVDQGRLTKDTKLILVKEQSVQGNDTCPHGGIDGELNIDVEIDQFLDIDGLEIASKQKAEICLKVLPLSSAPIPDFLNPVPDLLDDLETIGLAKIENLATIGCFSGDIVSYS